jgi:ATP-dependent DNA helicase DinG
VRVFFPLSLSFNSNKACFFNLASQKYFIINTSNLKNVLDSKSFLVCNKKELMSINSNINFYNVIDILELILFLFPTIVCSPNPFSIYKFLSGDDIPKENLAESVLEQEAVLISEIVNLCGKYISELSEIAQEELYSLASFLSEEDWIFAPFVLHHIKYDFKNVNTKYLRTWELLKEYRVEDKESIPKLIENETDSNTITDKDVLNTLHSLTAGFGKNRIEQVKYASTIQNMFNLNENGNTNFVFAEAGTGTGKTLGYLAPVLSFIEKNPTKQVLISTYSKALQKQIIAELKRAFVLTEEFEDKVISIKGSNNYICLLNYKSLLANLRLIPNSALFLVIISRWTRLTENGDLISGDLSPLMFEIFSNTLFAFLLNRKEECIYSKCPHFKNCFIMSARYKAKKANIIVSNHAFSLLNSCLGAKYVIFDEAHHLFSSSDDVFSMDISCISSYSLRVWINGSNSNLQTKKETNGFKTRLNTLLRTKDDAGEEEQALDLNIASMLDAFVVSSNILPDLNSSERIKSNIPKNVTEEFLYQLYLHVLKNNDDLNQYYTTECGVLYKSFSKDFIIAIENVKKALEKILNLGSKLYANLKHKLVFLNAEEQFSLEEFMKVFESVCLNQTLEYYNMLEELEKPNNKFIYRFMIEKEEGNISNIGYYKNYIDPSSPLAKGILSTLKGVSFTSATLSDSYGNEENEFSDLNRFGLNYLDGFNVSSINIKSPFNYKENSKIIILNANNNVTNLSNYILEIFKASNGGGLALFTAINRLKQVYRNINVPMSNINMKLMAQHINNQKISSLIDIFKDDTNSCLLGTDSARDGIDVPGESLRIVIFEKVPWPKPDILLKARVNFLGSHYIDQTIRLKLRQAFGRIIRKEEDRGIFILLQSAVPSELLKAFPNDIEIKKSSLENAIIDIKTFFDQKKF